MLYCKVTGCNRSKLFENNVNTEEAAGQNVVLCGNGLTTLRNKPFENNGNTEQAAGKHYLLL